MNGNATVRDLFELCDSDGKGYVSRTSICSLAQFLPFSVEQLEAVFDSLDVDHNGQLTFEEFSDGFSMMINDEPPETNEAPRAQRKHRTIRDIQRSAQSDARAKAREYFELCDAERKQYVTRDDIMRLECQLGLTPDQLHFVFDSLDADRKGFLTIDDFTDGISNVLLQSESSPQFAERQSLEAETPDVPHQAGANSNPSSLLTSLLDANVDKRAIDELWNGLRRQNPALLPHFELLLEQVSTQIQKSRDELGRFDKVVKQSAAQRDEELKKLYEEVEFQLRREKDRIMSEAERQQRTFREELEHHLAEKETQIRSLMSQENDLKTRLTELAKMKDSLEKDNEELAREKDQVEEKHYAMQRELEEARRYSDDLQKRLRADRQERAMAAIKISEGIALERENLVRQLETLRELNQKLQDEKEAAINAANAARKKNRFPPKFESEMSLDPSYGGLQKRSFSDARLNKKVPPAATKNPSQHDPDESAAHQRKRSTSFTHSQGSESVDEANRQPMDGAEHEDSDRNSESIANSYMHRHELDDQLDARKPMRPRTLDLNGRLLHDDDDCEIEDPEDFDSAVFGGVGHGGRQRHPAGNLCDELREAGMGISSAVQSAGMPPPDLIIQPKLVDACVATDSVHIADGKADTVDLVQDSVRRLRERANENADADADGVAYDVQMETVKREVAPVESKARSSVRGFPATLSQPTNRFFKVILLGDSSVGKTTLVYRLATGSFKPDFKATIGVDFATKTFLLPETRANTPTTSAFNPDAALDDQGAKLVPIGVQFWDTAGTERYRAISRQYFKKCDGAILMYDITSAASFVSLRSWLDLLYEAIDEGAFENISVLICGSKLDLVESDPSKRAVTQQAVRQLADPFRAQHAEVSSRTGQNLDDAIEALLREVKRKDDKRIRAAAKGVVLSEKSKSKKCCS